MENNNFELNHIESYDYQDQNFWLQKYLDLKKKYNKLLEKINDLENKSK